MGSVCSLIQKLMKNSRSRRSHAFYRIAVLKKFLKIARAGFCRDIYSNKVVRCSPRILLKWSPSRIIYKIFRISFLQNTSGIKTKCKIFVNVCFFNSNFSSTRKTPWYKNILSFLLLFCRYFAKKCITYLLNIDF